MSSGDGSLYEGTLRGTVARVLFENRESGWAVLHMELADVGLATVVGPLAPVFPGESLEIEGRWEDDPRYGRQFRARSATPVQPQDEEGIRRYLASGVLPGVGQELARRIVARFGADTLRVLDEEPERLRQVSGIGDRRLADIREAWQARSAERQARIFLQGHGLGPTLTDRILREWGEEALARVRRDPYELIPEIRGIGFRTADALALRMGRDREAPERILAGVDHVLREAAESGSCFLPRQRLVAAAARLLELDDPDRVAEVIEAARRDRELVVEPLPEDAAGDDGERGVWLPWLHHAESRVARRLAALASRGAPAADAGDGLIRQVEVEMGIELGDEQRQAVARALGEPLLVVTGGPGTGKTTLVDALVRCARQLGDDLLLAAPTGRAAKRLELATGHPAATIHRMLEYRYEAGFTRGPENPLEADLLVVDEVSMVDLPLMDALLGALPPDGRLLLVGDADQLPSVGPGAVLRDVLESGVVPTVRLREIYRQAARSLIVRNAHRVNAGRMPEGVDAPGVGDDPETTRDFYVIREGDADRALELVLRLVTRRIPDRFGMDPMRDVQVLAPMHRGRCGVARLNLALQRALNPAAGDDDEAEEPTLRRGDRVMQLRNDYDREVFNGDIGRVAAVADGGITVDFDGREVGYEGRDAGDLTLAYAVSIHKSQGSEYPAVVALLLPEHHIMLQRNLLYTALTRARRLAVLIGTSATLGRAVDNAAPSRRETLLAWRLRAAASSAAGSPGGLRPGEHSRAPGGC